MAPVSTAGLVDGLEALLAREVTRFAVPGAAVAVVHDGEIVVNAGFGVLDLDSRPTVTATSHFPLASDTKAFTAAALALLAHQGQVDLDAPLRSVLPSFAMSDAAATAVVSTRDLLAHRSGLPRHDLVTHGAALSLADVTARLPHLALSRSPRQAWQYCNLGYCVAGHVIEHVCAAPWHEVVRDVLLAPLRMDSTVVDTGDPRVRALAAPHKSTGGSWQRLTPAVDGFPSPAGAMVSTTTDLARWLLARLGHAPEVLPPAVLDELHTPVTVGGMPALDDPSWIRVGYALGCQVDVYRGHRLVRHGGTIAGFTTNVCVLPDDDIGIAVLTNAHGSALRDALPLLVADLVLGHDPQPWGERYLAHTAQVHAARPPLPAPAPAPDTVPPSPPLDCYVGSYRHPAYGTLRVEIRRGVLVPVLHALGDRIRLRHCHGDEWMLQLVDYDLEFPTVLGRDAVMVRFEPELPAMQFVRTPDSEARPRAGALAAG